MSKYKLYLMGSLLLCGFMSNAFSLPLSVLCKAISDDEVKIAGILASNDDIDVIKVNFGRFQDSWYQQETLIDRVCAVGSGENCGLGSENHYKKDLIRRINFYLALVRSTIERSPREELVAKINALNEVAPLEYDDICKR